MDFVTKHHSIAFLMICQCISAISNHLSSQLQEASKFYLFSSLKYHHRLLFIHIHSSTHYMFASSCSHLSNAQDLWSIQLFTFLPHVTFTPAPIRTMLIAAYSILQFKALLISLILLQVLSLWFTSQGIDWHGFNLLFFYERSLDLWANLFRSGVLGFWYSFARLK